MEAPPDKKAYNISVKWNFTFVANFICYKPKQWYLFHWKYSQNQKKCFTCLIIQKNNYTVVYGSQPPSNMYGFNKQVINLTIVKIFSFIAPSSSPNLLLNIAFPSGCCPNWQIARKVFLFVVQSFLHLSDGHIASPGSVLHCQNPLNQLLDLVLRGGDWELVKQRDKLPNF